MTAFASSGVEILAAEVICTSYVCCCVLALRWICTHSLVLQVKLLWCQLKCCKTCHFLHIGLLDCMTECCCECRSQPCQNTLGLQCSVLASRLLCQILLWVDLPRSAILDLWSPLSNLWYSSGCRLCHAYAEIVITCVEHASGMSDWHGYHIQRQSIPIQTMLSTLKLAGSESGTHMVQDDEGEEEDHLEAAVAEGDAETFDDSEFYQQLLKEFLEGSAVGSGAGALAASAGVGLPTPECSYVLKVLSGV